MDSKHLRTIVSKRFDERITDINSDVFKVVSKFKGREFATHYFDCSQKFLAEGFDLLEYQKSLLSVDYYRNTGPLQWNFYLYFITETSAPVDKKIKIESDKSFTRKLVATQDEIVKLIEIQAKLKDQPKAKLDKALLSVWKNRLKEIGLGGIYLTFDYPKINDVFQHFLDNREFIETIETDREVTPAEVNVSAIAQLDYKGFRCFTEEGNLSFKKVNLIKGVNGVGKTSLLEGIELCLCGQTIENSKQEPVQKLEVKYVTNIIDKYSPEDNKKFQARDRAWYGINTLRGNTLSQGFHIYNFFDSEASFRFAKESNTGEIVKQIFSRIVLGEQTNIIFDRIERFADKLSVELKTSNKLLKEKSDERLLYQGKLKEFDSGSEIISTLGEIINILDEQKWSGTNLLLSEGSNRAEFQKELRSVQWYLENILGNTWINNFTLLSINSELQKANNLLAQCDEFTKSFEEVYEEINQVSKSRLILDDQLRLLDKAAKYYSVEDINEIVKLESRIQELEKELNATKLALDRIIELAEFENAKFNESFDNQKLKLGVIETELEKLRRESETLASTVDELSKLRTDLERIGSQYVAITNDTKHCPLCRTNFPKGDVLTTISSVERKLKEADLINSLAIQIERKEKAKENLEKALQVFSSLILFFKSNSQFSMLLLDTITLNELRIKLLDTHSERTLTLSHLTDARRRFVEAGLIESEFNILNTEFALVGLDEILGKTEMATFVKRTTQLQGSQKDFLKKELELKSEREDKEINLIKKLSDHFKDSKISTANLNEYIEKLKTRTQKLAPFLEKTSEIAKLFKLDQDANLTELKNKFDEIDNLLERYLEIETQNKLRKEYLDKLDALKVTIQGIETGLVSFQKVHVVLEDIINNNNRENYLREFFIQNKEAILDIFKVIHLPNEFDDIQFESSETIKLKVKNSSDLRDLTEISTGQKSAFILSLFLSLNNNLQSGPPLMIFDDPIAYVDDINTLSFLDFLRDTVIAKDKQIFFATANGKLANLFQQKFDFLGDDFQIISLDKVSK